MRRGLFRLTTVVAFVLAVLVLSSYAQAAAAAAQHQGGGEAEPAGKAGDHPAGGAAGEHEVKTRDSLTEKAFDLTLWTIIVFFLLVLVLGKFAWKPMLEGLQKRERGIESDIEQARKDQEEAAALRAQHAQELAKIKEQERTILDQAYRDAQAVKDRLVAEARTEIQAERDRAHREIENAREQAVRDLWEQTAQLATLVSAKAIRRNMTLDDHRNLVDEAVAELNFTADGGSKA